MKKTFKKEEHTGFEIEKDISIHGHINDPSSWFLTIRPLQIFSESLCGKGCNEKEIARCVNLRLRKLSNTVKELLFDVAPFI